MEPRVVEPLPHCFGALPGFPVGIEEELLIVDRRDGQLLSDAQRVLNADGDSGATSEGKLTSEIFSSEIELVSPVCQSVAGAVRALDSLLTRVHRTRAAVIGVGLHPTATDGESDLSAAPRYESVSEALRGLLRNPPAALQVHVGMPDPETAIRVANGMRRRLPLLHSLAANSPFWYGRDSGLACARAAILRSYPRYGVPRWFRDWEDFSTLASELSHAAHVPNYTYFWWDVRPHPQLGTIEVRAPDTQLCSEHTLGLAALIHALARAEAEAPPPYTSRDTLEEGCYQATRYGLDAELPDDDGGSVPARELAGQMIDQLRDVAAELGCASELVEGVGRILREGTGAELQRRVHRQRGMEGLLGWLISRRAGGAQAEDPPESVS